MTVREKWDNLRAALGNDLWRKLLALFLASLLYYTVTDRFTRGEPARISGVPVQVQLPEGVVNLERGVPPVTLVATGSAKTLAAVTGRDFSGEVRIPAGSFVRGRPYTLKLSPSDFRGPSGVRIVGVEPGFLVLNLEPIVSRRVPIEVRFDSLDRLSKDFQVDRIACVPDEVQLTGPESLVSELRMLSTAPIPLDQSVTDGFEYVAPLRMPDGVMVSPTRVAVKIDIVRKYANRTFTGLPLRILLAPEQRNRFSAELPEGAPALEVTVGGSESRLAALKAGDLKVYLDLSELREPGTYMLTPGCLPPPGDGAGTELKIRSIRPDRIPVKIVAAPPGGK